MKIEALDDKDNMILSILKENARANYSEIAAQVGLTRVAVANRIHDLEQEGIIIGYTTRIDESAAGDVVLFFLDLETEPSAYGDVLDRLGPDPMIKQLYMTSGDCRIHAVGLAPNSASVTLFVNSFYRQMKGIRRMSCHTSLTTLKDLRSGIDYSPKTGNPPASQEESHGRSNQTT